MTCVNTLADVLPCSSPDNTSNAIQVKETVQIQTFFAKIFGIKTVTLYAQAEAAERSDAVPFNIAIVLDTTASMQSTDPNCTKPSNWPNPSAAYTKEDCAKAGAATLLQKTSHRACPTRHLAFRFKRSACWYSRGWRAPLATRRPMRQPSTTAGTRQ